MDATDECTGYRRLGIYAFFAFFVVIHPVTINA